MGRWITIKGNHIFIQDKNDSLLNSLSDYYSDKESKDEEIEKYKEPDIGAYEKFLVRNEINNWCNIYKSNSKYKKGGIYHKSMFDSVYIFKIIDYNEYDIIDKIPIDSIKKKGDK